MTPRDIDRRLAEILSEYYPDIGTAENVARRAGVDIERVDTSGAVADAWQRIVLWARTRRRVVNLIDEARADFDTDELRTLKVTEMGEADKTRAIDNVGEMLSAHLDALRGEMHSMERRLNGRIDGVEGKIDALKAVSTVYSPQRRYWWVLAFLLFCAPTLLMFYEVRNTLGITVPLSIAAITLIWAVACWFFMLALGFIREL